MEGIEWLSRYGTPRLVHAQKAHWFAPCKFGDILRGQHRCFAMGTRRGDSIHLHRQSLFVLFRLPSLVYSYCCYLYKVQVLLCTNRSA